MPFSSRNPAQHPMVSSVTPPQSPAVSDSCWLFARRLSRPRHPHRVLPNPLGSPRWSHAIGPRVRTLGKRAKEMMSPSQCINSRVQGTDPDSTPCRGHLPVLRVANTFQEMLCDYAHPASRHRSLTDASIQPPRPVQFTIGKLGLHTGVLGLRGSAWWSGLIPTKPPRPHTDLFVVSFPEKGGKGTATHCSGPAVEHEVMRAEGPHGLSRVP